MGDVFEMVFPKYTLVEVEGISNVTPGTQIAVKGSFENLHPSLKFFYPMFSSDEYYYHHGVYLGECKVAHFSGENKADAKPRSCDILQFMKGAVDQKLYRVEYDNPDLVISIKATLDYAKKVIASPSQWPGYSLIANNCESFATWLKTGKKISAQAFRAVIKVIPFAIPLAIGSAVSGPIGASGLGASALGASTISKAKKQ